MAEPQEQRVHALGACFAGMGQSFVRSEEELAHAPSHEHQEQEPEEEEAEQDLGDGLRAGRNTCKSHGSRDKGNDQKDQSPFQHWKTFVKNRRAWEHKP